MKKKETIFEIICALFVILFLYTGVMKLLDHSTMQFDLRNQPYLRPIWKLVLYTVPVVEIAVAGLLLFPKTKSLGIKLSLTLMVVFTVYVAGILVKGGYRPCTCGGVIREMNWETHLIFNLFFTALAVFGVLIDRQIKHKNENKYATS